MYYAPDVLAIMLNIDSSYDTCDSDDDVPLGVDLRARVVQSLLGLKLISCSCSQFISGLLEVTMNCSSHLSGSHLSGSQFPPSILLMFSNSFTPLL